MKTVTDLKDLKANIDILEEYLNSKTDPEYSFALELIKRGICFVAVKDKDTYKFYPSRFIGYHNNNIDAHMNNKSKDGKETNPVISSILGCSPRPNMFFDKLYCEYCKTLGFHANSRGTYNIERKYWEFNYNS